VTDISHGGLLAAKVKGVDDPVERPTPKARECPGCHLLVPPKMYSCPNCGYRSQRFCTVQVSEGELIEYEMAMRMKREQRKENQVWSYEDKAIFFGQLRGYGEEKLYNPYWAANKYKDKFGCWPNDYRVSQARTLPCGPTVRKWIKSRMIAWAKSRPEL
jgi:hypothetical protein